MYLPATFIYHDLNNLKTTQAIIEKYRPGLYRDPLDRGILLDNGNMVNKYSMGIAMLNLPFFLVAFPVSVMLGYPQDGFSIPFQLSIYMASLFYVICGLFFLRLVLKKYFNDKVVSLVLLTLAIATNLYCYAIYESLMSHSYLFFLYSTLLYCTIKWYDSEKTKFALLTGLCCGLITLSRPNEIISILIPLLYGVHSFNSLGQRFKFIQHRWKEYAASIVIFILVGLPQLIYWKVLSGKFFYYSYGNEGFDFLHPNILSGLFSFQNGWLIYTPVMIFALAGIFLLQRKNDFRIPLLIYIPVYIYIIYSYWAWNYYNGFGSRPMVETYPLLSIPLGYMTEWALRRRYREILFSLCMLFFISLNIFQMWQYDKGILITNALKPRTYLSLFGRTSLTTNDLISYDLNQVQPKHLSFMKTVYTSDFNDSLDQHFVRQSGSDFYYFKKKEEGYLDLVILSDSDLHLRKGEYVKISYRVRNDYAFESGAMTSIAFSIDKENKTIFWKGVTIQNKAGNDHPGFWNWTVGEWFNIQYFICIPPDYIKDASLKIFLWDYCNCNQVAIDDLSIEIWN
jgi:hypothetical protein